MDDTDGGIEIYSLLLCATGQKIHVFIIPEVQELMQRELRGLDIPQRAIAESVNESRVLEDVVAWLIINSLRSEQTQWTMLCIQNIGNLYRKNAFQCLRQHTKSFLDGESSTPVDDAPLEYTGQSNKEAALKVTASTCRRYSHHSKYAR